MTLDRESERTFVDGEWHCQPSSDGHDDSHMPLPRYLARFGTSTWASFLMPMTTLGLSTLLDAQQQLLSFKGLRTIGIIIYLLGVTEFVFLLTTRLATIFSLHRHGSWQMWKDPHEAMFFATFWISIYGIISGGALYSSPGPGSPLAMAFFAFFWIYVICALLVGIGLHLFIAHVRHLEVKAMTPAWLLPVLPIILIGVCAADILPALTAEQACPVLIAGLLCSSMGFLLSLPMAALYLQRLFVNGLPKIDLRPGMMIAVGPPTYAPLAFLKMTKMLPKHCDCFGATVNEAEAVRLFALLLSIGIFGMAVFFLAMALCANIKHARSLKFHLTWYGYVFPNVGLLSIAGIVAEQISSDALKIVISAGTAIITATWIFVALSHLISVITCQKKMIKSSSD